jgi:hypothetical protein
MLVKWCSTYGGGHISAGDTLNGRIEVVEALALNDLRADLATDTKHGETTLHDSKAAHKNEIQN